MCFITNFRGCIVSLTILLYTCDRCVDHYNQTLYSSPKSVHHPLHHTSTGMPSFVNTQKYMQEQEEVRILGHILMCGILNLSSSSSIITIIISTIITSPPSELQAPAHHRCP